MISDVLLKNEVSFLRERFETVQKKMPSSVGNGKHADEFRRRQTDGDDAG